MGSDSFKILLTYEKLYLPFALVKLEQTTTLGGFTFHTSLQIFSENSM